MRISTLRAAFDRLALLVIFSALGACADQSITSPTARPDAPRMAAAGDVVPTAGADSTRVTFTIARAENYYYESTGSVGVNGTFACSRALGEEFTMLVKVQQKMPARGMADGFVMKKVTCGTTDAQPWVAAVPRAGGNFSAGRATVTVSTYLVAPEMVPTMASGSVKLALSEAF